MSFAVTIDYYNNWYFSVGGSLGPDSIAASGRISGGWIAAKQVASTDTLGVVWTTQCGRPREDQLESFISGWSVGGGLGVIGGIDATIPLQWPVRIALEPGIYSPQIGVGGGYTWHIYDSGSTTPWYWQRKWGLFT